MSSLGELLKTLRGKRSLRDVADATELSHTYISDIEKGFRRGSKKPIHPSPDTLKRLAEAYNYPYEELMKVAGYIEEKEFDNEKVSVAGQEITLSLEELKLFQELKKHPIMFHDLASNPEKKVKELIKLYKMKKMILEDDDEELGDGFGELED